ncbi:MAG TPA: hypothetical protein VIJ72_03540 [Rhizomicrobium sp.]
MSYRLSKFTGAIAIAAIMLPAMVFAAEQDPIAGAWQGLALQPSGNGKSETWTITMKIDATGNGTIDYPSLNCGGTLTRLPSSGDVVEFHEKLTYGLQKCVDDGTDGVRLKEGKLIWYWVKGSFAASAVLFRPN